MTLVSEAGAFIQAMAWPRIYHLDWPRWKHEENSIQGIGLAKRLGFTGIDLDLLITKDSVIVVCHWHRPQLKDNFFDPHHRIAVRRAVEQLTWAELQTLRSKDHDHHYRIIRVERALAECARRRIKPVLEPKDDKRFEQDWPWVVIVAYARQLGILNRVYVYSIRNLNTPGAGVRRVAAARKNGIPIRHSKVIH